MSNPAMMNFTSGINQVSSDNLNTFMQTCTNMAQLRAFAGNNSAIEVFVRGYTTANDGGQGLFYWNAGVTGTDDNGITTVVPSGVTSGCWSRQQLGTILLATSTTSVTIGTGTKTFTIQSGLALTVGAFVIIVSRSNTSNYMSGQITSYVGSVLTVNVLVSSGSGTYSDWNIILSGTTSVNFSTNVVTVTSSATPTIDLSTARSFKYTTAQGTTFTFSNPDTSGTNCSFSLFLFQDGTGETITWPGTVKWSNGIAPTLTAANAIYTLTFTTMDGGTTYYGYLTGEALA